MDRETISSVTGSLSFVIWLFAQSPQLYENYRRGSVDGLSPVFLTQWMLGDVTNLIGSVLTQQLPFQIAVATYFCIVDACICVQFTYYYTKARRIQPRSRRGSINGMTASFTNAYPANPYSLLSETSELLGSRSSLRIHRSSSQMKRSLSQSQNFVHHSFAAAAARRSRSRLAMSRSDSHDSTVLHTSSNYRALSNAALSVAQLAQEAAWRRDALAGLISEEDIDNYFHFPSASQRRSTSRSTPPSSRSRSRTNSYTRDATVDPAKAGLRRSRKRVARVGGSAAEFVPSALSPTRESNRDVDEVESDAEHHNGDVPSAMMDSISSLGTVDSDTQMQDSIDSLPEPRGRDMTRTATRVESTQLAAPIEGGSIARSSSADSSDGTARTADRTVSPHLIPTVPPAAPPSSDDDEETDRDVHEPISLQKRTKLSRSVAKQSSRINRTGAKSPSAARRSIGMVLLGIVMLISLPVDAAAAVFSVPRSQPQSTMAAVAIFALDSVGSWHRLVGRMSAWTCTVLYLTSRIPQIWENYIRRSVRGLSILLFISAFMGNLLYTISVLSNPEAVGPGKRGYLQESLPFLLGSGGTLIFDLIIIVQWCMWSSDDDAEEGLLPESMQVEEPSRVESQETLVKKKRHTHQRRRTERPRNNTNLEESHEPRMTQSLILPPKAPRT